MSRSQLFLAFFLASLLVVASTIEVEAQRQTRSPLPRTADRLGIGEFSFDDEIDEFYNTEQPRLEALCRGQANFQSCRVANLRPFDKVLAVVRDAPSEQGQVVGELHAVLYFHPRYDLGYRIDFIPRDPAASRLVWLDSVGDWGYGIEVPGVRAHGDWIQLFDGALPRQSWIPATSPSFHGAVNGIVGALISLPRLSARYPDGSQRPLPAGSYFIKRVQKRVVTLRREIAADFPCGEAIEPPRVMPASLEVAVASLFSAEGDPLFSLTYSRGC